jgi:poly(A) polymerase
LARAEHQLSRREISSNALKVLYRLHRSGHLAYLVGGGVRDILLGARPKDFDIATNARPEEIRRLFRNSRIIGRRFRLVHVVFRDEIVEVSTFRASAEPPEVPEEWEEAGNGEEPVVEPRGEEVVFGTPAEDARRRDFTVNALFYDIADFSIIDHVGGIRDLAARILRTIGPPEQRFVEDPVRMMRALEYSVRLGFDLEPETAAALERTSGSIREAAPARLSYELLEALRTGKAAGILAAWRKFGLWERAFPGLPGGAELDPLLAELDRRIGGGERLGDAVVVGALFLPQYARLVEGLLGEGRRLNNPELIAGLRGMLEPAAARMHVANHTVHLIHNGLFTATRLRWPPERGRQVVKLVRQDCFPVTWDLASLGVAAGLLPRDAWQGWARAVAQVQARGGEEEPEVVVDAVARTRRRRRRGRRRR